MFWFGVSLMVYLLIGITISHHIVKTFDKLIQKYEVGEFLTSEENEILNHLSDINKATNNNALLLVYFIATLFWLPIQLKTWLKGGD